MRVVCFADTHTQHSNVVMPDGDVLLFAGDGEFRSSKEVTAFDKWLGTLPHKVKIVICGNHDFYGEGRKDTMKLLFTNATYLENEAYILPNGMKLWGSPWTPRFFDWAFMKSEQELIENWALIPKDTDILLTHGPAYGFLDIGRPRYGHVGDRALAAAITKIKPQYHVFGHIHGSHGGMELDDVAFINCAVLDEDYAMNNEPLTFEVK